MCIYQVFRPRIRLPKEMQPYGDCSICTSDYKNKLCIGYRPIKIYYKEVFTISRKNSFKHGRTVKAKSHIEDKILNRVERSQHIAKKKVQAKHR